MLADLNSVSQVDGISDMGPACQLCGVRVQKRDNGLCSPWCQTLQFLPVYHWCLSSFHPSAAAQKEWVWVGETMCGLFKRNCLGALVVSSTDSIPAGFCSCGVLSSWHWNPGLEGPHVGLGLLALEISLLNFYPPHVSVGPAFFTSVFLLQVSILVVSLIL